MIKLQADVSGEDILSGNYAIVVCTKDGKVSAGFKFSKKLIAIINSRYGQGLYRYEKSKTGRKYLKIRIYSVILSFLIRQVLNKTKTSEFSLHACRDFDGHANTIKDNLKGIFGNDFCNFIFQTLPKGSPADHYAFQLRSGKHKRKSKHKFDFGNTLKVTLEEIEYYL